MLIKCLYTPIVRVNVSRVAPALLLSLAFVSAGCGNSNNSGNSALASADPATPSGHVKTTASAANEAAGASNVASDIAPTADAESYTITVDAPTNGSAVHGNVVVSGHAPGFTDLEVWDASGALIAQAPVYGDNSYSATVDTSQLPDGAVTWTVNAFDGLPSLGYGHEAHVSLALTIGDATDPAPPTPVPPTPVPPTPVTASCDGVTCSGHGTCAITADQATCNCDAGYSPAATDCLAGAADPGLTYVPAGYHLAFSDEFSDATLDTSKWNTAAPWNVKWYKDSHQLQSFIPEAITLNQGAATFTADYSKGNTDGQPYGSGSITTNRTFTHGYFETRVSLPAGKGFWPAYWLTSSVRWPPELDIFEVVDGVDYGYTHIVPGGTFNFVEGVATSESKYAVPNMYGAYHVYGFQWTETDIYRYVDGTLTEHDAVDAAAGSNDPFWLNLSLQVGGDWPGNPDATTPFPSHMNIDYVRVYQQ